MKQSERLFQRFPPFGGSSSGGVTSIFGRTGDVLAEPGDYHVEQVTQAVPDSRLIIAGGGITGGGSLTEDVDVHGAPWSEDVDANAFQLLDVGAIGVGTSVPITPLQVTGVISGPGYMRDVPAVLAVSKRGSGMNDPRQPKLSVVFDFNEITKALTICVVDSNGAPSNLTLQLK